MPNCCSISYRYIIFMISTTISTELNTKRIERAKKNCFDPSTVPQSWNFFEINFLFFIRIKHSAKGFSSIFKCYLLYFSLESNPIINLTLINKSRTLSRLSHKRNTLMHRPQHSWPGPEISNDQCYIFHSDTKSIFCTSSAVSMFLLTIHYNSMYFSIK